MNPAIHRFLQRLRASSSAGIVESQCPQCAKAILPALLDCGAVRRVLTGRAVRICVANEEAMAAFLGDRLPLGLEIPDTEPTSRSEAVRLHGNAKACQTSAAKGVFVRSLKPGVQFTSGRGVLPIYELTVLAGGAAVAIEEPNPWCFAGQVALVENEEAFWQHERALPEADLAVFGIGRVSGRVLRWLAGPGFAECRFLHWGDYDAVGIAEYVRVRNALPGRVRLHVPDNIEHLLSIHGERDRYEDQLPALSGLRGDSEALVTHMVQLFDKYRRGLDQELLLDLGMAHAL